MKLDLIYDVGMHLGNDSDFYLKKGFRVVAIEANPLLVAQSKQRLSAAIADGRLTVLEVAIADHEGTATFYRNEQKTDWGTISPTFAAATEKVGTTHELLQVPAMRFDRVLAEHGTPYYLKIDIEGTDLLCVKALEAFEDRPRYVSVEASGTFDAAFNQVALLWTLGYRQFKLVNQGANQFVKCPNPPLEGRYVDAQFDGYSSGPFGEEAPGIWLDAEKIVKKLRQMVTEMGIINSGTTPMRRRLIRAYSRYRELRGMDQVGWYDLHAKLPGE